MTHPEELTQLELEHIIRYGTWEERAAHDAVPEEEATDDDEDTIPLSSSDLEIIEPDEAATR